MLIRTACAGLTALGICTGTAAQGHFDLEKLPGVPEYPTVQVDLDAALLDFMAAIAERQEPAVAEVIGGLDHVRVLIYDMFEDSAAISELVEEASAALEREGWRRTVYVREDDVEKVRIYTQIDGQNLAGMKVLVLDPEEAVFINIAGPIEPAQLGRVANVLGFSEILGMPRTSHARGETP